MKIPREIDKKVHAPVKRPDPHNDNEERQNVPHQCAPPERLPFKNSTKDLRTQEKDRKENKPIIDQINSCRQNT